MRVPDTILYQGLNFVLKRKSYDKAPGRLGTTLSARSAVTENRTNKLTKKFLKTMSKK